MEGYYADEAASEFTDIPATDTPVWILGVKYNALHDAAQIKKDICTKIWVTYRKGFVPIGDTEGITSDKGWGCMLRCGQMVLAQALVNLHLGRDWTWSPETKTAEYLQIIHRLEDRRQAPFSIHQIAQMGVSEGKAIGQWFGPNTVAQVLKKLVKYDDWTSLEIHVALDNLLIINDIRELCKTGGISWKPLLLLVPLRLGLNEINPIYIKALQNCFKFHQSLGIIGGKPNMALWFMGFMGNEVFCLDPHTTQKSGTIGKKETEDEILVDLTYHCRKAPRMNILTMDPSIALCFFCKTEKDFNDLCDNIKEHVVTSDNQMLFEIILNKPTAYFSESFAESPKHSPNLTKHSEDSDEFEVL
ncbi:cysteine protease ATG4A [Onthophagus taurus]|uniref:cysteine protease ATG4A n=1 Tax=Onthophagus taurus TaxID=166361 RepID=UPI000C2096AD|nr:cysteine protease ATG4A [Onthophagus taurus]